MSDNGNSSLNRGLEEIYSHMSRKLCFLFCPKCHFDLSLGPFKKSSFESYKYIASQPVGGVELRRNL